MNTAPDFHDEVLLSLEDLVKADPHCVQCNNGLTCVPLNRVPDVAYKLLQKHANLESLVEHQQNCPLDLELGIDNCSAEKFASLFLESKGPDDAGTCQFADNAHSPLKRHFKDVCQKISEVNEIQGQPAGDKHVIAARVESIQHTMKSVDKTLRDHEGQLSALDDTQRRVAEEFSNLEMRLTSLQKNRIRKDVSLKDIQASLANLEANLASYRHDLRQQLRDKNNGLHQCISDSLTGLQSSQLSLDERLTILEKKADGIRTAQDKHTGALLAGPRRHTYTHGFPITPSRVLDDGETAGLEDLLQRTTGVDGAASSGDDQRSLLSASSWGSCRQFPGAGSSATNCQEAQLCTFILASVAVFLAFIGFFSAFRGSLLKTQEVMDRPLWIFYFVLCRSYPEPGWQRHFLSYIPDAA
ncbi:hypothetical protein EDC04DRAFT_2611227 [Pisolithus marmoratus]|nr:hypothetical protein EDC04DRAFT_2611227 [Pisolithus marmoratus]